LKQKCIFTGLLVIQDKHADYFSTKGLSVIDYLAIDWLNAPFKITINNGDIPLALKADMLELLPNVQDSL
jgi:hypothetical protein